MKGGGQRCGKPQRSLLLARLQREGRNCPLRIVAPAMYQDEAALPAERKCPTSGATRTADRWADCGPLGIGCTSITSRFGTQTCEISVHARQCAAGSARVLAHRVNLCTS